MGCSQSVDVTVQAYFIRKNRPGTLPYNKLYWLTSSLAQHILTSSCILKEHCGQTPAGRLHSIDETLSAACIVRVASLRSIREGSHVQ